VSKSTLRGGRAEPGVEDAGATGDEARALGALEVADEAALAAALEAVGAPSELG